MALDKIEKIRAIGKEAIKGPGKLEPGVEPNKDYFEALMRQGRKEAAQVQAVDANAADRKLSPIEEIANSSNRINQLSRSPQDLIAQAQDAIKKIDSLKEQLNTPNLELKNSVQSQLKNRLTHINENLSIALSKAGVEYTPQAASTSQNPIERFLGFLTDGQARLQSLSHEVETMNLNRKELSPASMLLIQIKVGFIQQELEFFTSVLNKALESTKTIMNVQV